MNVKYITGKLYKSFAFFIIILTTLFLLVPIIFTIFGSVSSYWGTTMFSQGITLEWFKYVFQYYGQTIGLTLIVTTLTVLINVFVGSMAAYRIALSSVSESKWVKLAEELLTLPAAVPGIAIGLALIQSFPGMRRSGLLILVGHVIFTFPLMFRSVSGAIRSTNLTSIDECARSLGAGPIKRFFTVIFPALRVPILSGAINVFMTSLGEFNITFFLYTPTLMTFPVGMYESYASLRIEVGSAFTTLFLALAIPLSYVLNRLNKSKTI